MVFFDVPFNTRIEYILLMSLRLQWVEFYRRKPYTLVSCVMTKILDLQEETQRSGYTWRKRPWSRKHLKVLVGTD